MKSKVWTIPNILSLIRICLIPLIVYLYRFTELQWLAGIIILLSGITDIVDGYIARKLNQVSSVGKILDPIADKLTLLTVLTCIFITYNPIMILVAAELLKDILVGITSYIRCKFNGKVHSAGWHGKVCTALVYATILLHIFFTGAKFLTYDVSGLITIIVSTVVLFLGLLYSIDNLMKIDNNFS